MMSNPVCTQSYQKIPQQREASLLLLCEHAFPHIPKEYGDLGIRREDIYSHYGWDIGAYDVFQKIVQDLEVMGIYSKISRLLIDPNRVPQSPDLIRKELDPGNPIPGNLNITEKERQQRLQKYWQPYHNAVEEAILSFGEEKPLLVTIHSFTPILNGEVRDLDIGLLYYPPYQESFLMSQEIYHSLSQKGYHVEFNKPYSVENPHPYPIHYYAEKYNLSYVAIEINNRLIREKENAVKVGKDLALFFKKL